MSTEKLKEIVARVVGIMDDAAKVMQAAARVTALAESLIPVDPPPDDDHDTGNPLGEATDFASHLEAGDWLFTSPNEVLFQETIQARTIVVKADLVVRGSLKFTTLVIYPGATVTVYPGADLVYIDRPFLTHDVDEWGNGIVCGGRLVVVGTIQRLAYVRDEANDKDWLRDHNWQINLTDEKSDRMMMLRVPLNHGEVEVYRREHETRILHERPDRLPELRFDVWRSVNITATRDAIVKPHIVIVGKGSCEIVGAKIKNFGRTTMQNAIAGDAIVSRIGRYPVHFHRATGECAIRNCVIQGAPGAKWGIAIHDTDWAIVDNNLILDCLGAGIVVEGGHERANTITRNVIVCPWSRTQIGMTIQPHDQTDILAVSGDGIWLASAAESVIDKNVVIGAQRSAYWFHPSSPRAHEGRPVLTPAQRFTPQSFACNRSIACGGTIGHSDQTDGYLHVVEYEALNHPMGFRAYYQPMDFTRCYAFRDRTLPHDGTDPGLAIDRGPSSKFVECEVDGFAIGCEIHAAKIHAVVRHVDEKFVGWCRFKNYTTPIFFDPLIQLDGLIANVIVKCEFDRVAPCRVDRLSWSGNPFGKVQTVFDNCTIGGTVLHGQLFIPEQRHDFVVPAEWPQFAGQSVGDLWETRQLAPCGEPISGETVEVMGLMLRKA